MIKKYLLEITIFVCGAVLMVYELVGSRILAPYLGSSIYVWTSLIGVILGSLSLGYWLGGRISDKNPRVETLSLLIFIASLLIFMAVLTKDLILAPVGKIMTQIELSSLLASAALFAPASVFLGMVSPYCVKLTMNNLKKSGTTVGNLYAISTIGSIFGTFLAGFFLIPFFGSVQITIIISLILVLISLALAPRNLLIPKIVLVVLLLLVILIKPYLTAAYEQQYGIIDRDTKYNYLRIFPGTDFGTGRKTLNLMFDPTALQSAIFLEGEDDLVFDYTKMFRLAGHFNPDLKKSLLIGGAAYTYPRDYLKKYPNALLDVVEIDEQLTELAKKYFRLTDDPRLTIFHEDGRTFLNNNNNKYDVIFMDAFQSISTIPYQLTTEEAVQKMYDSLNDNGIVMVNMITGIEGDKGKFLRAEYATFKSIFPQIYILRAGNVRAEDKQNLMLVAFKSSVAPDFTSADPEQKKYLSNLWTKEITTDMPILTDDHAPVDFYIRQAF
jgi:spermidine synthase